MEPEKTLREQVKEYLLAALENKDKDAVRKARRELEKAFETGQKK